MTQKQINEVSEFQSKLNAIDKWLFFYLAWVTGDMSEVTFENKYEVMQNWQASKSGAG